jgi:hypothetical protein
MPRAGRYRGSRGELAQPRGSTEGLRIMALEVCETLPGHRPKPRRMVTRLGCGLVEECLFSMGSALGSIPSTAQRKRGK